MSLKPHYFKIGIFVIIATLLILSAIVIFGAGLLIQEKIYFETYFDESVSGLSVGATVELRGVPLGQVDRIAFVRDIYDFPGLSKATPKYGNYVVVQCSVPRENLPEASAEEMKDRLQQMASEGLRVRLASNLLTGQALLQAEYLDPNRFSPIEIDWEPKHLYVPSAPSTLTTLKDSVDKVLNKLQEMDIEGLISTVEELTKSLTTAVNDADVGGISKQAKALLTEARVKVNKLDTEKINTETLRTIESVNKAVNDANIPTLSRQFESLFTELRETNRNLKNLLTTSKPETEQTSLPQVVARLDRTLKRIEKFLYTQQPQLNLILLNFKEITENLKNLSETLSQNPSELIFSEPPPKSEPVK
jgi:phospholipid/cholesterol/gamma-HCH transport system substrate-binding protein/paraquat-inducible protein B